jgi:hypothetical protein
MVRGFSAAWLLVALAAASPLRAADNAEENPLRLPELILRPDPDRLTLPQQPAGPFTLPAQRSGVRMVSHLEDDSELAPIVPALPEPALVAPPQPEPPPKMLTGEGLVRPTAEAWQGAVEPELPPAPAELTWRDCFTRAAVPHTHPNDPQRHLGFGEPLTNTSWRNRPLYVGFFAGGLIGDELQEGIVSQGGGFFGGARFGGDFDHYWGLETRLAFSDIQTNFAAGGGYGQSRDSFFDASVLYYPWGDSRWRPYATVGLGVANYRYALASGAKVSAGAMEIPWGGGVKYLLRPNVALRFDLIDNLSLEGGSRSDRMHNISFTGGIELRFGGRRTNYGSW